MLTSNALLLNVTWQYYKLELRAGTHVPLFKFHSVDHRKSFRLETIIGIESSIGKNYGATKVTILGDTIHGGQSASAHKRGWTHTNFNALFIL